VSAPRGIGQAVGVAQRLHEQQDRVGVRIVDQEARDLADREVDLVADRDQPREADAAGIRPGKKRSNEAAALANHRPTAAAQFVDREGGVCRQRHRRIGAHRADAVGADQSDAGLRDDARKIILQRRAGLARIGEAAGQDGRDLYAALAAGGQRVDGIAAVEQDIGVVDLARDRVEVTPGLLAQDFAARRILTGRISPVKPCLRRNRCGREVVLRSSPEAPMRAMRLGSNKAVNRLFGSVMFSVYAAPAPKREPA